MPNSTRDPWLWGLILVGLAAKAPLLWLNWAEYTDGIIQLHLFENGCPFYMPLYTLLCQAVAATGVPLHIAGRIVSLLAHGATLWPLHFIAVWLTGSARAGRWTAGLYLLSTVPNRWAIRVMTDSLFALWWWGALALFLAAAPQLWGMQNAKFKMQNGGGEDLADDQPTNQPINESTSQRVNESTNQPICPFRATALGLGLGMLAALTRQTGWILLPPGMLLLALLLRRDALHALRPLLILALWALPVWWMVRVGSVAGHGGQVAERLTPLAAVTLLEAHALDWPLVVGWPLAVLSLWGLFRPIAAGARWRWFVAAMVWSVLSILALQVLIQSYLFRYLLPLVGFACILGGGVLARLAERRPRAFAPVAGLTVVWLALTTLSVLWFQREAWGDARFAAEEMGAIAGPETPLFANETYATWPPVATAKASHWSGREVTPLLTPEGRMVTPPPGSLVLINSANAGGAQAYRRLIETLQRHAGAEVLGEWESRLIPFMPDIMDGNFPVGLHQNPLAIRLRRVPQQFRTALLRIGGTP